MRILVTGHGGYIGTVLVPLLARAGHDVVGIDSMLFDESAFGRVELDCETRRLDVRDLVATDVDGFEAVIHLAGLSNDPLGDLEPTLRLTEVDVSQAHDARAGVVVLGAAGLRVRWGRPRRTVGENSVERKLAYLRVVADYPEQVRGREIDIRWSEPYFSPGPPAEQP
jgi:uncharacterized protein YbjT (DUF2867 family)